jgi:hypothetical protein
MEEDTINFILHVIHADPEKGPEIIRQLEEDGTLPQAVDEFMSNGGGDDDDNDE